MQSKGSLNRAQVAGFDGEPAGWAAQVSQITKWIGPLAVDNARSSDRNFGRALTCAPDYKHHHRCASGQCQEKEHEQQERHDVPGIH
jgi:hypothetical protein